jgi:hypothetical protein
VIAQKRICSTDLPRYYVLAVAKFFIAPVVILLALLLWWFVSTLIMRLFGVRLPFNPFSKDRKRASQLLTFSQSVWVGVLFQGCGMFIAMTLFEYLAWKYWNAPSRDFSLRIRVYVVLWPAYGLLMGFIRADDNRYRGIAAGSPGIGERGHLPPRQ